MHRTRVFLHILMAVGLVLSAILSLPNPARAAGTCAVTAGQVLINEILPAASDGVDWIELYNTTDSTIDLSYCYIDDIAGGGGSPIQIAAGTTIAPHGFWTMDRSSYFNNAGDDVRLLKDDAVTILDSHTYGSTDYDVSWYRSPDGGDWAALPTSSPTKGTTNGGTSGVCGTGSWVPGTLEIHHLNIGQGDSTLVVGPTGTSLLIDAGETYWNSSTDAQKIGPYVEGVLGCKQLDYILITHFHSDHLGYVGYGGLWNLVEVQGFTAGLTLHRNYDTYLGTTSGTFENYVTYLDGVGAPKLNPAVAVEGTSQINLGAGVTFDIVTVDGNGAIIPGNFSTDPTPPSENDYSIGAVISYGSFDEWIGGDLDGQFYTSEFGYYYHDIETTLADELDDIEIYRANHHGSDHSNNATFINQLDPEVAIISVGDDNTYGHPRQSVVDLLLATADLYLTEHGDPTVNIGDAVVAGDIVVRTSDGTTYTVNGVVYTAAEPVRTDADNDGYFAEVDPADNNALITPALNGGCNPIYQVCTSCQVSSGQVLVNEILPAASSGVDWLELYNTTGTTVDISYCYIDDIAGGGGSPYQIPAGTIIPAYGFWTLDRTSYFNNDGDDVRFVDDDLVSVLDSYTFGATAYDVSWYRLPNGGAWQPTPTSTPTKGAANSVTTPYLSPTAQAATTGGDGNGFQTNPTNAYSDNAAFAVDLDSGTSTSTSYTDPGKDRHLFYNYGFNIPAGVTIAGIEIQLQAKVDSNKNTPMMYVQLSWDGGVSWTTAKATPVLAKNETTYLLGGLADTWGRTWSAADFSNANFRIRIINVSSSTARDFYLDWVSVRVQYR